MLWIQARNLHCFIGDNFRWFTHIEGACVCFFLSYNQIESKIWLKKKFQLIHWEHPNEITTELLLPELKCVSLPSFKYFGNCDKIKINRCSSNFHLMHVVLSKISDNSPKKKSWFVNILRHFATLMLFYSFRRVSSSVYCLVSFFLCVCVQIYAQNQVEWT